MAAKREFTSEEARKIGDRIGVDWQKYDLEDFRMGLAVELEHGVRDPQTYVTGDDEVATGKIDLSQHKEIRGYYTRLLAKERDDEA